MDRQEEVGTRVVGYLGAPGEVDPHVCGARIEHFHLGHLLFDHLAQHQRDVEHDILFVYLSPDCSGLVATVPGVYHDGAPALPLEV